MLSIASMRFAISVAFYALAFVVASIWAADTTPWGGGLVLLFIAGGLLVGRMQRSNSSVIAILILVIAGYAAFRIWHSPVADLARSDALLLVGGLGVYWWTSHITNARALLIFRRVVYVVSIVQVVVVIMQQWVDPSYTLNGFVRKTEAYPSGLYGHYNHLADFLLVTIGLALGNIVETGQSRWSRIILIGVLILNIGGLILSQSRGGVLGFGVLFLVFCVVWYLDLSRNNKPLGKMLLVVPLVLLPIIGVGGWRISQNLLKSRLQGDGVEGIAYDNGRYWYWSIAESLVSNHALEGGGARSFSYESLSLWPRSGFSIQADIVYVHNEVLQAAVDYGVIGAVGVLILYLGVLLRAVLVLGVRSDTGIRVDSGLVIGAMLAMVGMGVQSMVSFVFHVMPDVMLLGFSLGVIARQPWPLDRDAGEIVVRNSTMARFAEGGCVFVSMSIGVAGAVFGWRDATAWFLLQNRKESLEVRCETAYKVRPDFRLAKGLGKLLYGRRHLTADNENLQKAESAFANAVLRHPFDYESWANRASILDELGRLADAEKCYDVLLPILEPRERYYQVRARQANHALLRGDQHWNARNAEEALAWFLRAHAAIRRSFECEGFTSEGASLQKTISEKIVFLEGAGIKPAELPPAKQWEFPPLGRN